LRLGEETDRAFRERIRVAGDPVADAAAQVRAGNARFTVLTDRLLRLEWAPDGRFEDRGSYAFPNRRAPVPDFETRREGETTVIDTGALVLRHTPDGRPLHAENTSIELSGGQRWVPGMRDLHNLGGARRTVDGCRADAALEQGLVSRSGWALFDDSAGFLFSSDGTWAEARAENEDLQDWYFFGYAHDYAGAIADYTRFGGSVPLVPRFVLGAWWSRYWPYSADDVRELAAEFRARGLPLDVFVLDMDWHTTDSWTGYTWNRELFPDPPAFLDWLHGEGLHTTLNLHPALGVQAFEEVYPEFARALGVDPASGEPVPFRIADPAFARLYLELLHHPREDEGVDFWWIDWQQGRTSELRGLDPLPWLNHLHFNDMRRHADRRPLIFSRWGGLGSHRYPIGFSGDAYALWSALQFQPRYTAAGANVAYGWWSHDIGGHFGADEPELYARWVQFGALSPVLRLHSQQGAGIERLPWKFGDRVLDVARQAFRLRYELVPYLYTAARVFSDTGAAPVRPLSWVAPERDGAYLARYQYMLGDAILAAPVVHPAEPSTGLATVDAWLPDGDWIERTTGERFTGPRWVRLVADLERVPQFVRPGTVLPLAEVAHSTGAQPSDHLVLSVFGGAAGETRVYDDDGWTTVTSTGESVTVDGVARRYTVRFEGTREPTAVTLDGAPHDDWRHEGATTFVEVPAGRAFTVAVTAEPAWGPEHDAAVRAEDLRRLLSTSDGLEAAVRGLPEEHPARPAAVARIGGPAIQVIEHTAPDEAAAVLGRVIVAAPETGPQAYAEATWTLERGGARETVSAGPVAVAGDAAVIDAPWAWDGSLDPLRWSVDVRVTWGDLVLHERRDSQILNPALGAWSVRIGDAEKTYAADPLDLDFGSLAESYVLPLYRVARPGEPLTVRATSTVAVPDDRDVAFAYRAGGAVSVAVDGTPLQADVTGAGPVPNGTLHPWLRRTAPVRLTAGEHTVQFTCEKPADLPAFHLYLSAAVVQPDGDAVMLDVSASSGAGERR
jgi:Glycosyl hydrolases family 31